MNTQQQKSDVALREEAVLQFWTEHDIFNKSLDKDAPNGDFVFYDGPPFATGLPHYGHILAGTIKDAIPRFWTMNGYRVRRKWGWDCHGLPLENLIEKKLGLATKRDIEEYGIKNFNEAARGAVMEYADDWREIIPRMGRWADMHDDYKTMDSTYTESVWWVFKSLHEKGLVYEGFKSMHLCPRCGTTLSNFEVNQGYKDIKDIAITVKLPLLDDSGAVTDTSLLVWTTTPWTMPGNMAAAVHKDYEYAKVALTTETGVENVVLAKERLSQLDGMEFEVLETIKGADLIGRRYQPPFAYWQDQEFEGKEHAWQILHADYVELGEEGTGAVHLAPAYGADDMDLAKEHGVPLVHHVDEAGHFKDFVTDFAGQLVKPKDDDESGVTHLDADIEIVKALKANGTLLRKDNITHSYPHCWRCDTPLLNYATTSWFVEVTKIKDQLVAENNKITWVPEHVGTNRFGKWLEGARDWAVSRQRYWGAPLPIWRNPETKDIKVFGSIAEMSAFVPTSGNTYLTMRHGESESNAADVVQTDVSIANPLTDAGVAQVTEAVAALKEKGITKIIASPFERTKQTATMVQEALGLSDEDLVFDERIGEIKLGDLEGRPNSEYQAWVTDQATWCDCAPTGGETWGSVRDRMGNFLYDIEAQYKNETILIVSHNSPLRMLAAVTHGSQLPTTDFDHDSDGMRFGNAEVRELDFTPLPHNDHYELDFHRPYIDDVVLEEDGVQLQRVPDVFDCWFESGSMPYGQHHYPFAFESDSGRSQSSLDRSHDVTVQDSTSPNETVIAKVGLTPDLSLKRDKEVFEKEHFPAQFIAEGLDQTRGWFYSLIVLGTALFGKSPYQNVIVNGLIMAEDGKKLSKKLQNYSAPLDLADKVGADSMRFFLLSSPVIRGEDINFSDATVQELQRKNIGRLHNVVTMYEMFADGTPANSGSDNVLDRWIVTRLNQLIAESTAGYKNYELDKATRPVTDFIDDLSVWYLRRSRDRLKGVDADDRTLALGTLRYVLEQLALVIAPSMPFYAEHLWQVVKADNAPESVHLAAWPAGGEVETELVSNMLYVRSFATMGLNLRSSKKINVRQPLSKFIIKSSTEPDNWSEVASILADELNVKEIELKTDSSFDQACDYDWNITSELQAEGDVREFMRAVQGMRKDTGLEAQDDITLTIQASEEGAAIITAHQELIQQTVGASSIMFDQTEGKEIVAGEHNFIVTIVKQ